MLNFNYLRADKSVPQLGDSISSRILPFNLSDNNLSYSAPLAVGAYLFNEGKYKSLFPEGSAELLFLFGPGFVQKYSKIPIEVYSRKGQKDIVKGGHYFLRGKDIDIFVQAGEIGKQVKGAPGHSDIFTFDLFYKGKQFIVDPGTYSIFADPDLRSRLRSIRCHNSVYIDDMQISMILHIPNYWNGNQITMKIFSLFSIMHILNSDPVICKRTFHLNKENINLQN